MSLPLFDDEVGTVSVKALSLWQPHAQAIALGIKIYETRSCPTYYRGPLVIHTAKKPFRHQDYEREWFQEACQRLSKAECPHYALSYGEALCIVDLVDCVPTESIRSMEIGHRFWGDFTPGRFAFRLQNVRKIWPPIRVIGRQSYFSIEVPKTNEALR